MGAHGLPHDIEQDFKPALGIRRFDPRYRVREWAGHDADLIPGGKTVCGCELVAIRAAGQEGRHERLGHGGGAPPGVGDQPGHASCAVHPAPVSGLWIELNENISWEEWRCLLDEFRAAPLIFTPFWAKRREALTRQVPLCNAQAIGLELCRAPYVVWLHVISVSALFMQPVMVEAALVLCHITEQGRVGPVARCKA